MGDRSLATINPENWPFSLELLPEPAYLVGGAVRDALLGRQREYLDLDFVLPQAAVATASQIAYHYDAGFVVLDAERQIARVVFPHATVDFAQQEGEKIAIDLHRRDFTVNAIAYNPRTQELIDPLNGCADLELGMMRMVSEFNLQDDPLRLLRGYRQAAQLGFTIESATRASIIQLAHLLGSVAAERVRVEVGYLLNSSQGTPWLIAAAEDGVLATWLPQIKSENLTLFAAIDNAVATLEQNWPNLPQILAGTLENTIKTSWLAIAKLATLLSPSPQIAETELSELKYSRAEIRAASAIHKFLPQMRSLSTNSIRDQYFFFREIGQIFPSLAVVAVANSVSIEAIAPLINRYFNPQDPVAHPISLLSGNDLMQVLNLPPSRKIGELLTEIQVACAEGKILTKEAALKFAAQLIETN